MLGTESILNPSIGAGELCHLIEIQAAAPTQDAVGGQSVAWVTILTTRAAIRTASSKEAYQAMQFTAQVSHLIKIRWPGPSILLLGGQQVLFGSRVFTLQAVENVQERNRVLLLQCLEINGVQ